MPRRKIKLIRRTKMIMRSITVLIRSITVQKIFLALTILLMQVLTGCDYWSKATTLKITNHFDYELFNVEYSTVSFGDISPGASETKKVTANSSDYIYFYLSTNNDLVQCRTNRMITIVEGRSNKEFIDNDTDITTVVGGITGTLSSVFNALNNVSLIMIKQNETVIEKYTEYDFGAVLVNTTGELVFTIENLGRVNLTFETVNRADLADNNSGFFSITRQPLSSTIPPGNSTTFIIQFAPTIIGNNFNATVQIKTNSHINDEFVFIIKGNSRNYEVGDTGPAGGIVFYDKGVYTEDWRFLEAAPAGTIFTNVQWGANSISIDGTDTRIGVGKENTQLIVTHLNELGETGRAAQLCVNLNVNEFNDWFLPSRDELHQMYLRSVVIGGFGTDRYWSSSQHSSVSTAAWNQIFVNTFYGNQFYADKSNTYSVRAIRAF